MLKIGIIVEGKNPPDTRVPLTPRQASFIQRNFPVQITVQPSGFRSFKDDEYREEGVAVSENIDDCDMLLGVKEVPVGEMRPGKTYFFFSHTMKKQRHNRKLLQAILEKKITLVDYEALTDAAGNRLIAFGRYAGMVGAHNGMIAYGLRTGEFSLPRMKDLSDYSKARELYAQIKLPPMKIAVTGTGRVAVGAVAVLRDFKIRQVGNNDYLHEMFDEPVFTQLRPAEYVERIDGKPFIKADFYAHPERYKSVFAPYYAKTDLLINGIYYNKEAPAFFTREEMLLENFRIKTISDISCDVVPLSSIPATLRASAIDDPFFGYDPVTGQECAPFQPKSVDMTTIDNLPNELPRDASEFFSEQFIVNILPELLQGEESLVLERATIAKNGALTQRFEYLKDFVVGELRM